MLNCKKEKISKFLISIKVLFSLFLTYLLIFKGDAGTIIHFVGTFITNGNIIVGFIYLLSIIAIYPVFLFNFAFQNNDLVKIKKFLLIFDLIMILVNILCETVYSTYLLNIPISDFFSKFGILINGFTIISCAVSLCILALIKYFNINENKNNLCTELLQNNSPLSFNGRIERLPYIITKVILCTLLLLNFGFVQHYSREIFDKYSIISVIFAQIILVLSLYAANKRLKDIKWNYWLLLIWIIPHVGLFVGIPLLFIKSKYKKKD